MLEAVRNGDIDGAKASVKEYWTVQRERLQDPSRAWVNKGLTPQVAYQSLRQSLEASAPLDLKGVPLIKFMQGLPKDRRQQVFQEDLKYRALMNALVPPRE